MVARIRFLRAEPMHMDEAYKTYHQLERHLSGIGKNVHTYLSLAQAIPVTVFFAEKIYLNDHKLTYPQAQSHGYLSPG